MKILIVDDNLDLADMLSQYFKLEKIQCDIANDGKIALSMIQNDYDVILLDLLMPGFSGYDVIESLNNSGSITNQKIIILTAVSLTESEIQSLISHGVHMVLQKPIRLNLLIDCVRSNPSIVN